MAFLGLVSKREHDKLMAEMEAIKQGLEKLPAFLYETADAQRFAIPDPSVYGNQADLYRKLSWVLQAVDLTASAASLTPFAVKRILSGKEPKDIPNHEFEMLMRRPNPLDSRYEFLYGTVAMFMLTGNAYWYMAKGSENEKPLELWLIPSNMITPVPDKQMYLKGFYYYPGNGKKMLLEPWQVVHFRRHNPFNRFVGMSAVESIALIAQGDLSMQDWNTRLFAENNARLPGILTFEQMIAQDTWEKIKSDTREAAKKRELLMLRGVGQGGVNWMQNAVSQKEMEFLSGRKMNAKEIMDTLAPGSYTMLYENANEANSRTGAAVFNERTIYPKHVLIAEKITNEILKLYPGRPLVGEFEDIRITDRQLAMEEQREYSIVHTIKEIRMEYYGDEPLGDERDDLLPSQISASSGVEEEPEEETAPSMPMQEMANAENEPPETDDEQDKEVIEDLRKWERKAIKRVGRDTEFITDLIPDAIAKRIHAHLPGCTSQTAVKALFDSARAEVQPKPKEAMLVLQGLMKVLEGF